jgi:hypothetical protein
VVRQGESEAHKRAQRDLQGADHLVETLNAGQNKKNRKDSGHPSLTLWAKSLNQKIQY